MNRDNPILLVRRKPLSADDARDDGPATPIALARHKQSRAEGAPDRRATPRVPIHVDVSFTSDFVGLTGDLSEGGLFVATWRRLSVGTQVDIALSLPDGSLAAPGHVRWVRLATGGGAPGMGVCFDELRERDRARIEAFCAARAPWYYDLDE